MVSTVSIGSVVSTGSIGSTVSIITSSKISELLVERMSIIDEPSVTLGVSSGRPSMSSIVLSTSSPCSP